MFNNVIDNNFDSAKIKLILNHREQAIKMAKSILKKWGSYLDDDEIISTSDLSLCEAASRFDESKNASFITFLYYYLKGNLIKAITHSATINGLDRDAYLDRIGKSDSILAKEKLQDALNSEIADATIGSSSKSPVENILKEELYSLSKEAYLKLDDIERSVIEKIYFKGQQVMQVAKELGYSRCHISRIRKRSIEVLQNFINVELNKESKNADNANLLKVS
ncbi:MAG: sigma-70 family RNA polymerase sigma factor [Bdellovibrionota bacterium]